MRNTDEILSGLLSKRGITSEEDISEFLSDRPQRTYDPFLLLNMEAGVDLLLSEINSGTKICIYGDYDADGVTSICILSSVLKSLTDNFMYYIPSRFDEGYGLNMNAVKKIYDQGAGLIVTVDCGSVSYEEVEYAKSLGMKVIVTDHHSIDDIKADCILINPKQKECSYPFSELAGCGVAFKLAQALQQRCGLSKKILNDVLDLAAVGTVGDIVSLRDENRTIVKYGLKRINEGRRQAMKKLVSAISLKNVSSENIAFGIAPHINAAGRMAHAYEAVSLFLTDDEHIMDQQVEKLVTYNSRRKSEQDSAYKRCVQMISGKEDFIVLKMEDIHEGIGGIAAGKVKEEFYRPVVIVTPSGEGFLKGTGRSIPGIDIYQVLKKHSCLFERFGGHKSACGFLMKSDKLEAFKKRINGEISVIKSQNPNIFCRGAYWDMELSPAEITVELAAKLDKLEPFGEGNPRPLFMIKDVILKNLRFMGAEGAHAGFSAVSGDGKRADCVLFRKALELKDILTSANRVSLVGTVERQTWRGRERVQFIVEEIIA